MRLMKANLPNLNAWDGLVKLPWQCSPTPGRGAVPPRVKERATVGLGDVLNSMSLRRKQIPRAQLRHTIKLYYFVRTFSSSLLGISVKRQFSGMVSVPHSRQVRLSCLS